MALTEAKLREPSVAEDGWDDLFAQIARGEAARESRGELPRAEVKALLAQGFGALLVPADLGGAGLSYRDFFALVVRLGAADANVAHSFRNHYGFLNRLFSLDDQEKAAHWLRRAAAGELFANGVSDRVRPRDATGRADFGRFATTLARDADGFIVNGVKQYATGSIYADWLAIQATLDTGAETVTVVLPVDQPGVTVVDDWAGFGQRFTGSGTVILDNVCVGHARQILHRDNFRPGAEYGSSIAQLFLTAIIAGIVQGALDAALDLIKTRTQNLYFAPTVDPTADPLLQQRLGQLAANAFAAQSIILRAAEDLDRAVALPPAQRSAATHEHALSAAKAKVVIDELGTQAATMLFDIGGASATHRDRQLDRFWRNARTISTHNPASYKARAIGAYLARGELLPKQGFF